MGLTTVVMQDMRRIWRLTTAERSGATMTIVSGMLLSIGALVLIAVGAAVLGGRADALLLLRVLVGAVGTWLALVWASLFVPTSMQLNTPANARLLPRQRRRLQQMAAAGTLLISAAMALALGRWGAFPAVGFTLLGITLVRAGRAGGLLLIVFGPWPGIAHRVLPAWLVEAVASPAGIAAASLLLLPCGAWALRLAYPDGGDAHLDGRRWDAPWRTSASGGAAPALGRAWQALLTRFPYAAALRRDCRAPRAPAMLMHALGPGAHWSAWSALPLLLVPVFGMWWLAPADGGLARGLVDWLLGVGIGSVTVTVLFTTAPFAQQLRRTRGEQALLRLTPLAGDAARLNRRLAGGLLAGALATWALVTGSMLAAGWLLGASEADQLRQLALYCLGGQLAMTRLLGDFASELPPPTGAQLFLHLLQALANAGLAWLLERYAGGFWAWLALLGVLGAALALRVGWRRMLAAPPAYPSLRAG